MKDKQDKYEKEQEKKEKEAKEKEEKEKAAFNEAEKAAGLQRKNEEQIEKQTQ